MKTFKCEKCNKIFHHKNDYEKHKNKKKPCKKELITEFDFECDFCDKLFSSKYNLDRHLSHYCKQKNNINNSKIILEEGEIIKKNGKYVCMKCKELFESLDILEKHVKLICEPYIKYNNIYKFDFKTLARNIFIGFQNAGEIYIIQNDFNIKDFYKIGVTKDLNSRIQDFRCGNVFEPRLHYYFPCKNIIQFDQILKEQLKNFHIKREIYRGNKDEIKKVIETSLKIFNDNKFFVFEPELKIKDIIECDFCKKIFMIKQDLLIHYKICKNYLEHDKTIDEKKTDDKQFKCDYCNFIFTRKDSLEKHLDNRCKVKKQQENNKGQVIFTQLLNKMDLLEQQNKEIKEQNNKILYENKKLKNNMIINENSDNNTINYSTNNNTIGNLINFQLVAFGKEDYKKLTEKEYKYILNDGFKSVLEFVNQLHFDKNRPEYHNIYISNLRDNYVMVYDGTTWKLRNRKETIEKLYEDKKNMLVNKLKELINILPRSAINKFEKFLNNQQDNKIKKGIIEQIKLLLHNNRNIPLETKMKLGLIK